MNTISSKNYSLDLIRKVREAASGAPLNECYQVYSEISSPTMGSLKFAWELESEKTVVPSSNSQFINSDHSDLLNQILKVRLDKLSYFEKRIISKKLTTNFCEPGFIIKAEELEDLYATCFELNKMASQLIIEAYEEDVRFSAELNSSPKEGEWTFYHDAWDKYFS